IITQDFFYIDKTEYISLLEQHGSYNILLRPRRFGKTLFLSTLCYRITTRLRQLRNENSITTESCNNVLTSCLLRVSFGL
ncbi:MAG: hypothetical protein D3904_15090, partial [Candidatus Electrothrix sp. EH2]|nr:hypothetical protein [Candidatus Electrothrix sp. EH2]